MEIEIFTLCKCATTDSSGSLSILSTFDAITAPRMPTVYPICTLVTKMRFDKIEEGDKTLRISFMDTDGKPVINPVERSFKVEVRPDMSTACITLPLLIPQLKLETFGDYSIHLAINGRLVAQFPLYVRQKQ